MNENAIASAQVTQLADWWQDEFGEAWEPLESHFNGVFDIDPCSKIRVKKIDLGSRSENSIFLVFRIEVDDINSKAIDCRAQVRRVFPGQTLQPKTMLSIITEGEVLFAVKAREDDNLIQFKFSGDRGDRFSLRVSLGLEKYCEEFEL